MDEIDRIWLTSLWHNYIERVSCYDKLVSLTPGTEYFREPQRIVVKTLRYIESRLLSLGYGERDEHGEFRLIDQQGDQ